MLFASFYFQSPSWLLLVVLPLLLGWGYWLWSNRQLKRYCAPILQKQMLLSSWSWRSLPWRWFMIWLLMVIALAQPMWLSAKAKYGHQPVQWVAVVDVSRSMRGNDLPPSRLQQVRWALESLAQEWQPGDQAGLVVFSGSHHWLVPLTYDKALWLSGVSLIEPDMLPLQGSLLVPTVQAVAQQLDQHAHLVIFTDGGDSTTLSASGLTPLKHAGALIGVGTLLGVMQQTIDAVDMGKTVLPEQALKLMANNWQLSYLNLADAGTNSVADLLTTWRQQQPLISDAGLTGQSLQTVFIFLTLFVWFSFGSVRLDRNRTSIMLLPLLLVFCTTQPNNAMAGSENKEIKFNQLYQTAEIALTAKHYEQAAQLANAAFSAAFSAQDQAKALVLLGDSLMAQSQWFTAGQALRGAIAHDATLTESLTPKIRFILTKLPKPLEKSDTPSKAGNRFEGIVSDWNEASLAWETKDVLREGTTNNNPVISQSSEPNPLSSAVRLPIDAIQQAAEQKRQAWILSGEMRKTQQEKQLFYRRLFSLEAGLAAVQDKPIPIDGVNPW